MATLSARIYKARIIHFCDSCHKLIEDGEYYLYLYGQVDYEKPSPLRECSKCVKEMDYCTDEKYNKARRELINILKYRGE